MNDTTKATETLFAQNPAHFSERCRVRCVECERSGPAWNRIKHAKSCDTPALALKAQAVVTSATSLDARVAAVVRSVRSEAMSRGDTGALVEAVRQGRLSVSDAMNLDD